jgi:hypothetical protein
MSFRKGDVMKTRKITDSEKAGAYDFGYDFRFRSEKDCPYGGELAQAWHQGRLDGIEDVAKFGDDAVKEACELRDHDPVHFYDIPIRHVLRVTLALKKANAKAA